MPQFKTSIRYPPKKTDFLNHFKTPKNLPFLFYNSYKDGTFTDPITGKSTIRPSLTLELGIKPIVKQPTVDEIWPIVQNANIQKAYNHPDGKLFAVNIICNNVAWKSRRARGNIVFVPNEQEKEWYDAQKDRIGYDYMFIVDPTLAPNEIRATYWNLRYKRERVGDNIITTDEPVCVDGGIQLSPEGFSCIQKEGYTMNNYSDYFARGFM